MRGSISIKDAQAEEIQVRAAGHLALQVVDLVFRTAGATSVKTTNPIERCLRDIRTAAQHNCLSPNNYEQAGQLFLGAGPSDSGWCRDYRGDA